MLSRRKRVESSSTFVEEELWDLALVTGAAANLHTRKKADEWNLVCAVCGEVVRTRRRWGRDYSVTNVSS